MNADPVAIFKGILWCRTEDGGNTVDGQDAKVSFKIK
jgi:hypothetical protein